MVKVGSQDRVGSEAQISKMGSRENIYSKSNLKTPNVDGPKSSRKLPSASDKKIKVFNFQDEVEDRQDKKTESIKRSSV